MNAITYRAATADDLDTLASLRYEMEQERYAGDVPLDRETFLAAHREFAHAGMAGGDLHAWLAEADGRAVGCVMLLSWRMPPNARELERRRGLVTNVFTVPAYRRQGIGRHLMETLIAHARQHGLSRLVLWASEMGHPLYEDLGFATGHAMDLNL